MGKFINKIWLCIIGTNIQPISDEIDYDKNEIRENKNTN